MEQIRDQHFEADEHQNDRQGDFEIVELLNNAREDEVERAQTKNSKDIGSVNDKRIAGNRKNGRNRIDRKHQIGRLDHHQRQKQRRNHQLPRPAHKKALPLVGFSHRHQASHQPEREIFLWLNLFLFLHSHAHTGNQQKGTEDIENPVEGFQQGRARENEQAAHHQCTKYSPEEYPMLIRRRNAQRGKNQHKNEDVINA